MTTQSKEELYKIMMELYEEYASGFDDCIDRNEFKIIAKITIVKFLEERG